MLFMHVASPLKNPSLDLHVLRYRTKNNVTDDLDKAHEFQLCCISKAQANQYIMIYQVCAAKAFPFSMFFLSSGKQASRSFSSAGEILPTA